MNREREASDEALRIAVDRGAKAEKRADFFKFITFISTSVGAAGWLSFIIAVLL
jgi:hypothetical protein